MIKKTQRMTYSHSVGSRLVFNKSRSFVNALPAFQAACLVTKNLGEDTESSLFWMLLWRESLLNIGHAFVFGKYSLEWAFTCMIFWVCFVLSGAFLFSVLPSPFCAFTGSPRFQGPFCCHVFRIWVWMPLCCFHAAWCSIARYPLNPEDMWVVDKDGPLAHSLPLVGGLWK